VPELELGISTEKLRALAFFSHPDDESYSAAGTLALLVEQGWEVQALCLTRGEGGGRRDGVKLAPEELGAVRAREFRASCFELGIQKVDLMDIPDGFVEDHISMETARTVVERTELGNVDLVLTLGWDGAYGHRDHIATTRLFHMALQILEPSARPCVLHCAFEPGLFARTWKFLKRMPGPGLLADIALEDLGTEKATCTLRVDIESVAQKKRASIAAHRTQLLDGDPMSFLDGRLVRSLMVEESFVHVAGPSEILKELRLPLVQR